jgi:transposase-like protein
MARPNKGLDHVDSLKGDEEDKWRLKLILATLTGQMFVEEAYDELAIGPTQFANLRKQVLQGALDALQARPVGRPSRWVPPSEEEVEALRQRIVELEHDAKVLRARLELAILPILKEAPRPKRRRREPPPSESAGPPPSS